MTKFTKIIIRNFKTYTIKFQRDIDICIKYFLTSHTSMAEKKMLSEFHTQFLKATYWKNQSNCKRYQSLKDLSFRYSEKEA